MTFVRPFPDISGFGDTVSAFPSQHFQGSMNPDPLPLYHAVKENPEFVHSGVGFLVTQLAPPPARLVARAVFEVGHFAGHLLWDRATHWFPGDKSSESSAKSYQQHGGSGGTPVYSSYGSLPAGTAVHKAGWNPDTSDFFRKKGKHHCKKGYTLAKIGGAMMCIKLPRRK